jgi:hypothetical protein
VTRGTQQSDTLWIAYALGEAPFPVFEFGFVVEMETGAIRTRERPQPRIPTGTVPGGRSSGERFPTDRVEARLHQERQELRPEPQPVTVVASRVGRASPMLLGLGAAGTAESPDKGTTATRTESGVGHGW